ncbi:MAG: hypothetical protein IKX22_09110 [Prevotella sp.]|nr:hypothetical protein [Prevotella sp.]
MENNNQSERIERYLTGQMSPGERETFLADLRTDKVLRKETLMMAMMVMEMNDERVRQDSEVVDEVLATKKVSRTKTAKIIRWVASVAALTLLTFGIRHIQKINEIDDLFIDYYSSYEMTNSRGGDNEAVVKELSSLFNKIGTEKNMEPIIERLQTIYNHILSENVNYIDYSYMENDIAYYLAMAYIKDKNLEKAKEYLKPLANDNTQIKKLLNEIENW